MRKRAEAFLKLMLATLVLCTILFIVPQSVSALETQRPQIMVSMGDSFSSGEGIEPFYGQEKPVKEKVQDPDWLAHRSVNSWPGRLTLPNTEGNMAANKDVNWFFVATSGAVMENLTQPFTKKYKTVDVSFGLKERIYWNDFDIAPQVEVLRQLKEEQKQVDYITITIAGNDVGFADVILTCVVKNDPMKLNGLRSQLDGIWRNFYNYNKKAEKESTRDQLKNTYEMLSKEAGHDTNIIVAGYPKLLAPNGGYVLLRTFAFTPEEAVMVNESVSQFNKEIEKTVKKCQASGMNISFVSVEEAFDGHGAYAETPYLNKVELVSFHDIDIYTPPFVSSYSMHPNSQGAEAYAIAVQNKIKEIEKAKREEKAAEEAAANEVAVTDSPKASDDEIVSKELHFSGVVLKPEDVVLKLFDAIQDGDYELATKCLDPATEQQINFWGGMLTTFAGLFTGEFTPWGEIVDDASPISDVAVIECYSENLLFESNIELFSNLLPKIPGLNSLVCTEADVRVKYRYKNKDEYYTEEDTYRVRRYEWSGWRIEEGLINLGGN